MKRLSVMITFTAIMFWTMPSAFAQTGNPPSQTTTPSLEQLYAQGDPSVTRQEGLSQKCMQVNAHLHATQAVLQEQCNRVIYMQSTPTVSSGAATTSVSTYATTSSWRFTIQNCSPLGCSVSGVSLTVTGTANNSTQVWCTNVWPTPMGYGETITWKSWPCINNGTYQLEAGEDDNACVAQIGPYGGGCVSHGLRMDVNAYGQLVNYYGW